VGSTRRIVLFSVIRVALFAVPFAILMAMGIPWWGSALLATVIGACLSYLFLDRQRREVAATLQYWRENSHRDRDNDVENEALDRRGPED
jgi:hypothetical protein